MTKREASRETLERLAEAVNAGFESAAAHHYEAVKGALLAYRAEITPPLRTRAEVDAEIAATIRKDRLASRGLGMANSTLHAMDRLCAEPTAPEGKLPPRILDEPELQKIASGLQGYTMGLRQREPVLDALVRRMLKVLE